LTGLRATDAIVRWTARWPRSSEVSYFWPSWWPGSSWGQARAGPDRDGGCAGPLCFAVPVWLRGAGPYMQTAKSVGYAGRYAATPMLMLISLVLSWPATCRPARPHRAAGQHGVAPTCAAGPAQQRATISAVALCCVLLVPGWAADSVTATAVPRGGVDEPVAGGRGRVPFLPAAPLVAVMIDPPVDHVVMTCQALVQRQRKTIDRRE